MNAALILAGGTDPRFKMDVPKQFTNVNNRPLIVYTLEAFQKHEDIDEIVIICLDGWQEMVRVYAKQFHINKLTDIIPGGRDAQESTYLGLQHLKEKMGKGDIVVVHDAIRPMVSEELITQSMQMCRKRGMGVAATYVRDTIMHSTDEREGYESINRYQIMKVQTPQAYDFELLAAYHERAIKEKKLGAWDNSVMITNLGEKVVFSQGTDLNLKINKPEDMEMFRALYKMYHTEDEKKQ